MKWSNFDSLPGGRTAPRRASQTFRAASRLLWGRDGTGGNLIKWNPCSDFKMVDVFWTWTRLLHIWGRQDRLKSFWFLWFAPGTFVSIPRRPKKLRRKQRRMNLLRHCGIDVKREGSWTLGKLWKSRWYHAVICQANPTKNAARCDQTAFDDFLPWQEPDIDEVDPEVGLLNEAHLWHSAGSENLQTLHRQEQIAEYLMEMQQPNRRIAEKWVENHDAETIHKVKIIWKRYSESRVSVAAVTVVTVWPALKANALWFVGGSSSLQILQMVDLIWIWVTFRWVHCSICGLKVHELFDRMDKEVVNKMLLNQRINQSHSPYHMVTPAKGDKNGWASSCSLPCCVQRNGVRSHLWSRRPIRVLS